MPNLPIYAQVLIYSLCFWPVSIGLVKLIRTITDCYLDIRRGDK